MLLCLLTREGYPIQFWMGGTPGYPHLDLGWGTPLSAGWDTSLPGPEMGYPCQLDGVPLPGPRTGPPIISWMGYPLPGSGMEYPSVSWMGYPHQLDGVPPPGPGMEYPSVSWMGYPHLDLGWGIRSQLDGVPPWTWDRIPPSAG